MIQGVGTFFCAILVLSSVTTSAQIVNFEKILEETIILYSVQKTTDNGYILSGLASEDGASFVKLIKTNMYGDTLWTKKYPGMGKSTRYQTDAIQTTDGGYMLAGTSDESDNKDIFLIKTDVSGDSIWKKTYGDDHEDKSWSVQQTNDGGYLINAYKDLNYVYLVKVDSGGTVEWEKEIHVFSFHLKLHAIQVTDQGYAIVVKNSVLGADLIKLDSNGD